MPRTQNSLNALETKVFKHASVGDINVYVSWNVPVEALGTVSQRIVFGRDETDMQKFPGMSASHLFGGFARELGWTKLLGGKVGLLLGLEWGEKV